MTRMHKILTYIVQVLPDEKWSRNQALTNGGVRQAIFRIWEHLLRTIANMPPRSVSISLIATFSPRYQQGHRQSRLRLYIQVVAQDGHIAQAVDTLIRGSLLYRLYPAPADCRYPRDAATSDGPLPHRTQGRLHQAVA